MKKIINYFKNNIVLISCIFILLIIMLYSFYDYINTYYSYDYEKTIESYEFQKKDCEINYQEYCETLTYPLSPKEEFKQLDAKSLYFEVIFHYFSSYMTLILPLFMMIITVSKIHKYYSSGFIKNYLMREDYKKFNLKIEKEILKVSLMLPLCIFIIFILCCFLTNFNFNVNEKFFVTSIYNEWNYNTFYLYIIIHYITLVFTCIFYGNISMLFMNKNKNPFIVVLMSYITFFIIVFLFLMLQTIIKIKKLSVFYNILDFWVIKGKFEVYGFLILSIILATSSYFIKSILLKNKEKVLIENEKGII